MLAAWGRFVFRHRVAVLLGCIAVLAISAFGLLHGGPLTTGTLSDLESTKAGHVAQAALGDRAGPNITALFRHDTLTVDDPAFYEDMGKALAPLEHDKDVASVLSPVEAPSRIGEQLVSADRHEALAVVTMRGDITAAKEAFPKVRDEIKPGAFHIQYTGEAKYRADLDDTLKSDLFVAELVSLPLALLVLIVVFRSVVAATLPVVVGALSVLSAIACILQVARVTDMPQYTLNVASLIGLGLAIDYSLFYTSRFREELAGGASVERAVEIAMATAGHAVIGSGLAAGVGISGLLFFTHSYVSSMGFAGGVVVVFSMASALTLLPALRRREDLSSPQDLHLPPDVDHPSQPINVCYGQSKNLSLPKTPAGPNSDHRLIALGHLRFDHIHPLDWPGNHPATIRRWRTHRPRPTRIASDQAIIDRSLQDRRQVREDDSHIARRKITLEASNPRTTRTRPTSTSAATTVACDRPASGACLAGAGSCASTPAATSATPTASRPSTPATTAVATATSGCAPAQVMTPTSSPPARTPATTASPAACRGTRRHTCRP